MTTDRNQVGCDLRAMRQARGMTCHELARRAGIAASYVSHIERGQREPSMGVLIRLFDAVGRPDLGTALAALRPRSSNTA